MRIRTGSSLATGPAPSRAFSLGRRYLACPLFRHPSSVLLASAGGPKVKSTGCDSKARSLSWSCSWSCSRRLESEAGVGGWSWGRTWAGKPYQCLFGGPAACLSVTEARGCKSALRSPKANPGRRLFVASAIGQPELGGPECTYGARASSSASTLVQVRCHPYGGARRRGPWQ